MKRTRTLVITLGLLTGLSAASTALAYLSPEEVLLNRELYLPPTAREAMDRTARQAAESAERREREQEIIFRSQHPEDDQQSSAQSSKPAAGDEETSLSDNDMQLLQTIRLLNRVQENQRVLQYGERILLPGGALAYHNGAPLSPTGAGGVIAAITMVGSVVWTMWSAKRARALRNIEDRPPG